MVPTVVYEALIALLVITFVIDVLRRPEGQGALATLKKPSPLRWVVMVLTIATVVLLQ